MDNWLVSPCQIGRLNSLKRMLTSLEHPKDRVVVVATLPNPLTLDDLQGYADHVVLCPFTEHFIARWWNIGLDYVSHHAQTRHEAMVISSDAQGTPYSVGMLGVFMRQHNLTLVGANYHSDECRFFDPNTPSSPFNRVYGGCWMLAGESGLRIDENFRWWYSDDDFDMQARHKNGSGIIPGTGLVAEQDSCLSVEKQLWAVEDRVRYVDKWGREPW